MPLWSQILHCPQIFALQSTYRFPKTTQSNGFVSHLERTCHKYHCAPQRIVLCPQIPFCRLAYFLPPKYATGLAKPVSHPHSRIPMSSPTNPSPFHIPQNPTHLAPFPPGSTPARLSLPLAAPSPSVVLPVCPKHQLLRQGPPSPGPSCPHLDCAADLSTGSGQPLRAREWPLRLPVAARGRALPPSAPGWTRLKVESWEGGISGFGAGQVFVLL